MIDQTTRILGIAERIGLPSIRQLSTKPECITIYRITVYSVNRQLRNSVATLVHARLQKLMLEVVYEGLFQHKPLRYEILQERFSAFVQATRRANFDKLQDQRNLPLHSPILWLLERASGGYYKTVLFTPQIPEKPYSILVNAIDDYLPESIREVQL